MSIQSTAHDERAARKLAIETIERKNKRIQELETALKTSEDDRAALQQRLEKCRVYFQKVEPEAHRFAEKIFQ